ncbi:hypothetical protein ERN12_06890 [Rhodobacteraceae bacterium]|nr:hypothetical protein ERN12_06890 [Paracoccaceae bacterium]
MFGLDTVIALIASHGLWLVGGLALIEGPIVSVLSTWLAANGMFDLWPLGAVLLAGDLVGDLAIYALGRYGLGALSAKWRRRLGLGPRRLGRMLRHFRAKGGRTLIMGKLTHSAGAAVLAAAGVARMPIVPFFLYNLVASVPKTLAFMALGYFAGSAYSRIDSWISGGSLAVLGLLVIGVIIWLIYRRKHRSCTQT